MVGSGTPAFTMPCLPENPRFRFQEFGILSTAETPKEQGWVGVRCQLAVFRKVPGEHAQASSTQLLLVIYLAFWWII